MIRLLLITLFLCASIIAHGRVDIAFIPMRDHNGNIVEFEQGGQFGHIAVSYKGLWFHSHPKRGVELTKNLKEFGNEFIVLTSDDYNEPSENFVKAQLGKPFSYLKPWEDEKYQYCSKLIAQAFGIPPTEMTFSGPGWQGRKDLPRGALGASADKLYRTFLDLGFTIKARSCGSYLLPTPDSATPH